MYKFISVIMTFIMFFASFFGITIERKPIMLDTEKLNEKISTSTQKRLDNGQLTGGQIIVKQNGQTLVDCVYGKKSIAGGEELKGDETYRIASMTKPITALALLIEHERGNIDIFGDLSDYMPEFADMTVRNKDGKIVKANNPIKVYMLVSHVSGIDEAYINSENNPVALGERTPENMTAFIATAPLAFEPGTQQAYNTVAYDVAARLIEIVSGMDFAAYIQENIFDKTGMTDTTFTPTDEQYESMVAIHGMENGKAVDLPSVPGCVFANYPTTYIIAGGGLMSTAEDYSKFAEMLLNGGLAENGTRVVNEETVKLMATPVVDDKVMSGSQKWGIGVRVITDNNYTLPKGCFGWSGAYGTHFWVDPTNKITAVYMKNSGYDGGAGCQTGNELEKNVTESFSFAGLTPLC